MMLRPGMDSGSKTRAVGAVVCEAHERDNNLGECVRVCRQRTVCGTLAPWRDPVRQLTS